MIKVGDKTVEKIIMGNNEAEKVVVGGETVWVKTTTPTPTTSSSSSSTSGSEEGSDYGQSASDGTLMSNNDGALDKG